MKRKETQKESKSLKTFYYYAVVVMLLIAGSFLIKLIFIVQQSRFDGRTHFTLAVTQNQNVKEIISFSPQVPALAVLTVKDDKVSIDSLGKNFGIPADAQLEVANSFSVDQDVTKMMWNAAVHYMSIKTDATEVDYLRLILLSRETIASNKVIRDIALTQKNPENNTIIARALNDPTLASENISIQIVNASDTTGLGQRLGRVLTNMGANVVEVSTSQEAQPKSKIAFFGDKTYTLDQIEKYLGYPVSELSRQPIANIVIILGEDTTGTTKF